MELGRTAKHPLREIRESRPPVLRFSYNCVVTDDEPFILGVRERVLQHFDDAHVAIDFTPNSI